MFAEEEPLLDIGSGDETEPELLGPGALVVAPAHSPASSSFGEG